MKNEAKDIGIWAVSVCNSDCDGIDITIVKGTLDNIKEYLHSEAYCFDALWEDDSLCSIDEAEVSKDMSYVAFYPYTSEFHVDFCATRIDKAEIIDLAKTGEDKGSKPMQPPEHITEEAIKKFFRDYGNDLTETEKAELLSDNRFFEDVEQLFKIGRLKNHPLSHLIYYLWEDVSDLGMHADDGCRDEDDTDESFGEFIIHAHKDGNEIGKSALIEFSTGRILVAA